MNCGILALSKIRDLKGTSAFTLIHLARDNGVDLKLFQVKEKDLPLVHRPAIFHSEKHFEHIKNGEPLPDQKWTGYVLTQKSIGRPVSNKEAKTIYGEIGAVLIPAIIGAAKAAVVSAGVSAAVAGISGGDVGQAAATGAKFGAVTGGVLGGLGGIAAGAPVIGSGVGAKIAGAAQAIGEVAGNFPGTAGAIVGGVTGAASGGGVSGFAKGALGGAAIGTGLSGAQQAGGSLLNQAIGAGKGVVGSAGRALTTPAGATGATTFGSQVASAFGNQPTSGFNLGGLGSAAAAGSVAQIAKEFGPKGPEGIDFDPTSAFTQLRDTLGTQGLPPAAERDILNTVNTPLSELAQSFNPANDRTIRRINEAFDNQIKNAQRQFSQAGQNFRTSSDARETLQRLERDRATVLAEAEQEAFANSLREAIQSKQFALNQSIEANKFDVNLALELADAIGSKAALEAAIQQEDENQFNTLLAQILNIGFSGQDTALSTIATSLRGAQ